MSVNNSNPLQRSRSLQDHINDGLLQTPLPLTNRRGLFVFPHQRRRFNRRSERPYQHTIDNNVSDKPTPPNFIDALDKTNTDVNSTSQLGAASPGINSEDDEIEEFAPMQVGRGHFPLETPKGTTTWTISKWNIQMGLDMFSPTTEIDLEEWFANSSYKVIAHGITAPILIRVMQLNSSIQIRYILDSVLPKSTNFKRISQLSDAIARRLFTGDLQLIKFERTLFNQEAQSTVFAAFAKFRFLEETYHYMSARRSRLNVL